jgi:hypothetical protein
MVRSARAFSRGLATAAMIALAAVVALAAASCSSTPRPTPSGGTGACGDGYLAAANGTCPKGFCLEPDAGGCCGSQCATCEDEGLVSLEDSGVCPQGTCISGNLTEALTCCDVCPAEEAGGADAGAGDAAAGDAGAGDGAAGDAAGD